MATSSRVRNGEEYLTVRIARRSYRCEIEMRRAAIGGCAGTIRPGDRYVLSELPPSSEVGNTTWWRAKICEPCAHAATQDVVRQLFPHEQVTEWLIWSNHHKYWWGPEGRGYRSHIVDAGRYALADTPQWLGRGCGDCRIPEVLVPAPSIELIRDPDKLAEYARTAPIRATAEAVRLGRTSPWWNGHAKPERHSPVRATATLTSGATITLTTTGVL